MFTYMLAPMEDMTDAAFRSLCCRHGADMSFTEMVSIEALAERNSNALAKTNVYGGAPTQIQLIGAKEDSFRRFLSIFKPQEGFAGFNLNLGCPDPDMIRKGWGSALAKRVSKVKSILKVITGSGYRATVKMRLGLNQYEKDNKIYLNLIENVDADFYIVHARHAKQTYSQPADFSVYEACVSTGRPIIANGDITTIGQVDHLKKIGVKGAMIGRAAVADPLIFARLKGLEMPSLDSLREEYLSLADTYGMPLRYRNNILRRFSPARV